MAHFWIPGQRAHVGQEKEGRFEWAIARLPDDAAAFVLTDDPRQPVRLRGKGRDRSVVAQILRLGDWQNEAWVLQSPETEKVRVNGFPLVGGIRVLEDREEIFIRATGRIYFSTERAPRVEPFRGREEATPCPRCKGKIAQGESSVQCPQCRTWHHETTDMPCWTYSGKCALCNQATCFDTGFRWTPDRL